MSFVTIDGLKVKVGGRLYRWLKKNADRLHGWFKKPKPKPAPTPPPKPIALFMYDDTNIHLLPPQLDAVAGYVDGKYENILDVLARYPNAKHLPIAVFPEHDADCLDVETGDATPEQAPAWVKRQLNAWHTSRHDVPLPVLYTAASKGEALIDICSRAGLVYGKHYLWLSAHYDPALGKHLCGPKCGFGLKHTAHATQFTDRANHESLDESYCSAGFFA